MKSRDFCYWLQGYFEIGQFDEATLSLSQVKVIRNHLAMVFKHEIDPSNGDRKHNDALAELHKGFDPKTIINC